MTSDFSPLLQCLELLFWGSVVESKLTLLQGQGEALLGDAVVLAQHPFFLTPDVLNFIHVVLVVTKLLRMADPMVVEATHIQRVVDTITVCVHDTLGNDFSLDYRHQRPVPGVVHDLGIDPSLAIENTEDHNLASSATPSLAFVDAAEVAFVQLHRTCENLMLISGQVIDSELSDFPVAQGVRIGVQSKQICS
jgi:hypothetical protein